MTVFRNRVVPLILAGGRGTRIADLFPDLPKPAVPVAGKPFLAWLLAQLAQGGFCKVVVSGGYLFPVLKERVAPFIPVGMKVLWVEEKHALGTGGGAIHAAKESGLQPDAWLVINGDSYLRGDWALKVRPPKNGEACVVARKVDDISRYGSLEVEHGRLRSFCEKQGKGAGLINAGIYFLPRMWLTGKVREVALSMERDLIPEWIRAGRTIRVLESSDPFLDIGTPEDFRQAEAFFARLRDYP